MKSIIDNQNEWANKHNKPCRKGYLGCYQENLFLQLDGEDYCSFKKGNGNELEDKNGEKAKMRALISSSALCVNFFLYLKQNGLLPSFLKSTGIHFEKVIKGEFEKKLETGASSAKANLDFYIVCDNQVVGVESKFTEHYCNNHAPLKQSYLEKKNEWRLKDKYSKPFPHLANWINEWKLDEYSYKGKTYTGRFSPFEYLDVAQLIKHLFALNNDASKPYILIYIHYDIPCNEINKHKDEIDTFDSYLKEDNVNFISISYQSIFSKLKEELHAHTEYLSYMKSRYSL